MALSKTTRDELQLEQLREILLQEDRKAVAEIRSLIENNSELAPLVAPIIKEHLKQIEKTFPDAYVSTINELIDERLREKQDELINIIYPELGTLMKKYIANEFRLLREKIENRLGKARSGPFSFLLGRKHYSAEEVIIDSDLAQVKEVYIIDRKSGLLLANASSSLTADKDMIAGMLTAITSFAEEAFFIENEEVQSIKYGSYEIMVHSFFSYNIALAISGTMSEQNRKQFSDQVLTFAIEELQGKMFNEVNENLENQLRACFL